MPFQGASVKFSSKDFGLKRSYWEIRVGSPVVNLYLWGLVTFYEALICGTSVEFDLLFTWVMDSTYCLVGPPWCLCRSLCRIDMYSLLVAVTPPIHWVDWMMLNVDIVHVIIHMGCMLNLSLGLSECCNIYSNEFIEVFFCKGFSWYDLEDFPSTCYLILPFKEYICFCSSDPCKVYCWPTFRVVLGLTCRRLDGK